MSLNQSSGRPSRSGGPGHVEKRCHSSLGSQRRPVYQLFVFLWKRDIIDQGKHPVVNLKDLNSNIPYQHFEMEGLFLLNDMLLPGDKMYKIDLREVYFAISFSVKSRMYVRFQWKGLEFKLFCLCIELSSAPLVFTKLFKVLISLSWESSV